MVRKGSPVRVRQRASPICRVLRTTREVGSDDRGTPEECCPPRPLDEASSGADACTRRSKAAAGGCGMAWPPECRVAWIGAVSASLLPCHRCRSGTGSDRARRTLAARPLRASAPSRQIRPQFRAKHSHGCGHRDVWYADSAAIPISEDRDVDLRTPRRPEPHLTTNTAARGSWSAPTPRADRRPPDRTGGSRPRGRR
jgi:hypothetical protein